MSDDHNEEDILHPIKEFAEEKCEAIHDKVDDIKDTFEFASDDIDDKVTAAADKVDEKRDSIDKTVEELKETVAEKIDAAKEEADERHEEILEYAAETKESLRDFLDESAAEINEKREELRKDICDSVSESVSETEEKWNSFEEKIGEKTEEPDNKAEIFDNTEDALEQLPVTRRQPSIPQYVPRTYSRETSEEFDVSGVHGSAPRPDYDGYPTIDDVEPVPNGVKNTAENKSPNTVLWIVLGILVVLCMMGCCLMQAFIGLIKVLGG